VPEALADLLTVKTAEQEENALLSVLKDLQFPVADWEVGGAGVTLQKALGFILANLGKYVGILTAAGHPGLAAALSDPSWLDVIGEQWYEVQRARATYTKQLCRVTCDPGLGPVTINPGFTVRALTTKNVYVYQGVPVEVADGSFDDLEFTAESPGSKYADPVNSIAETITSIPGVSVINRPRPFGRLSGSIATRNAANRGSGSVLPSGAPTIPRIFTIIITGSGSAGASGAVRIEWLQAGVTSSVTLTPIPAAYIVGDGVTLAFSDGAGAGFIKDDRHTFETIGSAILANGVDDESNQAYAKRMIGRWPSLGDNIVADKYEAWVRRCSLDNAFGIEKITATPSASVAGQTDITLATATGTPSGTALSTIQDYVNARDGITDTANVLGAANVNITLSGTAVVKASQEAAAKQAADDSWRQYIAELPIGGDRSTGFPGVVRISELVQALMDAGAIDYFGLMVNLSVVNPTLLLSQVAVIPAGQLPSEALTWITVP
jgi:hypothetical protein